MWYSFFCIFTLFCFSCYASPVCGSLEQLSLLDNLCFCLPQYYRAQDGTCVTYKSLQIAQGYLFNIPAFTQVRGDLPGNFMIWLWAKQTYSVDNIFVQRGGQISLTRSNADSSITATIKYATGTNSYQTTPGAFPMNAWNHLIFIHDLPNSRARAYVGTTKVLDTSISALALYTTVFETNLTIGYNVGLVSRLCFFNTATLSENYLPIYIYQ